MTELIIPLLMILVCAWSLHKKEDFYSLLVLGAQDGLRLLFSMIPSLIALMSAVSMLRASGLVDRLSSILAPLCARVGLLPELVPLMLIRPLSGSAALAVGAELIAAHGADSLVGRTAAVMLGSTETTFYTISVYFGAAGVKKTRHTIPAALLADVVGFFAASFTARTLFQ